LGRQTGKGREIHKIRNNCLTPLQTGQVDIARMLIDGNADLTTQNRIVVKHKEGEKQEDRDKGRVLLTETS
jgi:hypothetical protein